MTNKLTLTEQEELFAKDCKLINLKYEYNGYTGEMGNYYGIICKRTLGEVSTCYRKIFSVCSSFHCTGRGN